MFATSHLNATFTLHPKIMFVSFFLAATAALEPPNSRDSVLA